MSAAGSDGKQTVDQLTTGISAMSVSDQVPGSGPMWTFSSPQLVIHHRLKEAVPLLRRTLGIFEKSLGREHPSTRLALANLDKVSSVGGDGT